MRLFRYFLGAFLVLLAAGAFGQTLTISGTITDSTGQNWVSGTWSAVIFSPNGPAYFGTTPVPTAPFGGALSGAAVLSSTGQFYNTSTLSPVTAQYIVTVCSDTSAQCSVVTTPVTSSAQLISALNAAITPPTFPAGPYSYGYKNSEVVPTPIPGQGYYNVIDAFTLYWNGSSYVQQGAGAGGPPTGTAGGDLGGTYPNPLVTSVGDVATGVLPLANYKTNPSTLFYINSASAFAGTPDGTEAKP